LKYKYFRDPVHGYIEVSPCALKIINNPFFQRLRNIKQLAFTNYVYHGAEHSRFGHSLGVYHLARKICQHLLTGKGEEIQEEFCLAALLHDIGHHPFSHCFEVIGKNFLKESESSFDHEDYSIEIIDKSDIGKIIESEGYSKDNVIRLITGSYTENTELQYLNPLISSELDLDRLDYLLRDSYYCGVPYGQIDLDRLFHSLEPEKNRIIISEKGLQSAEMYVLARYYMYTQVYTHRTTRAFDLMLNKTINKEIFDSFEYPLIGKDIYRFIEYDDTWLRNKLKEISTNEKYDNHIFAKNLIDRNPIRCVIEKHDLIERGVGQSDVEYTTIYNLKHDLKKISEKSGVNVEHIFIDEPWRNLPIDSSYHPYFSFEENESGEQTEEKQPILIKTRAGIRDIATLPHSIAFRIAKHQAKVIRVYTIEEKSNNVAQAIAESWPDLKHLVWIREKLD